MNMEKSASMIMSLNPYKSQQNQKINTSTHKIVSTVMTINMNTSIKINTIITATVIRATTTETKIKASE
jgi:hypothetical protein